ncbi:hypothetical protein HXY32_03530 [Candidatus Bathyarchaeota archaeon]|nr:hypothetical protein [Candidatus Bathyarchaeota archaeon]
MCKRGDCSTVRLKEPRNLLKSKRALTIPVTYLILFVSLLATISVTYSYAIVKISARGAFLKTSVAKQNLLVLDSAVHAVAWSFGASEVVYMDDCGGTFKIEAAAKNLVINFTDEQSFSYTVFNSSVGKAFYELESSESSNDGLFVKGDYRAIGNQSTSTMTQIYFNTDDAKKLTLSYRPSATALAIGTSNRKPLNLIRIYIINLNFSQSLTLKEKFYLKVVSLNVTTFAQQYNLNVSVSSLALKAAFDGTQSTVWLPVSSNAEGLVVNLEIVVCNVKIQKAGV